MIGFLRSKDRFTDRLEMGPEENMIRSLDELEGAALPLIGCFAYVSELRVLFYRWEGALRLRLGDKPPIILADARVSWISNGSTVTFSLKKDGVNIVDISYNLSDDIKDISDDITPMVEAEHFDIFLLVSNVLSDAGRFGRIYPDG